VSVASDKATELMQALLNASGDVKPAGLGARDTLRIEAGLCLYGQDIDEQTTPVEATLMWTIGKRRRAEGGFIGAEAIMNQFKSKSATKKRVGFMFEGRQPARAHTILYAQQEGGDPIGEITSGTFSPVLGAPLAMGYVDKALGDIGTTVYAQMRKTRIPATVSKMPFVPANYFRG
jgi:aminomethyltransferase